MPGNLRYGGQNSARPVPKRAMSLDSLHDKNASLDLKVHEYIPSRITRTSPKINESAMQFVKIQPNPSHLFQRSKTGPAVLYKSATEQIKKAEAVKAMRQHLIDEEADWQAQPSSSSSSKNPYDEGSDWQSNLDKWKSSRRKRNEEALIRAIEIKKHEQEEELIRMRRKSKTFSEIQEDKSKRGRRYNLVVHNDDSSDLSGLGLSSAKSTSSLSDAHEENDVKDLDQDNKDAKSDAGFCTGSDTGSDGVFAEDNISDTSSALGDKKEAHDSLLDTGVSKEEDAHLNGHGSSLITDVFHSTAATIHTDEYTYDKAIAGYKQYAENSAKKRTSSITSLNSNTSYTKDDDRKDEKICVNGRSPSPNKSNKVEEKLNFFSKEMEKDFRSSPEPRVIMREKSPRVDVGKRRSMFETRDPSPHSEKEQRIANRRSLDVSNSLRHKVKSFENLEIETPRVRGITPTRDTNLRNKVASFENLDAECTKVRTITPTRDAKFYEKRASFAAKDYETQPIRKKTPERDVNFHRKLASFTSIENREEDKVREIKTIPQRDPTLRTKIASFEQLEQSVDPRSSSPREEMLRSRDRSVSLEHLNEPQAKEVKIRPARSLMNITRRMPSTPYMVVDLEGSGVEEKCVMETKPMVNAQVFELASKLEETPLLGSPIHKAPTDLPPVSLTHEDDSFEGAKPYTDDDINEVISDYEQVSGAYEDSSGCAENIYENITEEPMYENIYEKVDDESHSESQDTVDEHHYQTLEEVREEVKVNAEQVKVPPSVPASSISPPVLDTPEVLDVTWTDGPSQAAPPSEPPPPPPPDDDSDIDASDEPQSLPTEEEDAFTRESSTRRLKKELWRRRSDFLGTSSQYIEEETVKPPPDLSDLLRQERDSERCLLESQVSRNSIQEILSEAEIVRREREIIESLERSEQQKQQQHEQYIWDDGLQENITNETKTENDEHMQYQEKLAELEEEMMRHDKDMLRRTGQLTNGSTAGSDSQPSVNSSLSSYATHGEHSPFPLHHFPQSTENSNYNFQQQSSSHLPIQEFYTAPTYESAASASMVQGEGVGTFRPPLQKSVPLPAGSPSQYSTLASPHPFSRSNSQSSLESSKHPPVQAMRSVPLASPRESIPEPLPRKKKAPPPTPSKSLKLTSELNNAERLEAIRVSRMPTTVSVVTENDQIESQGPSVSPSGQQMSKQTLLALSAIPKPRLTDNESWITKKKPDAQKRDYSKHWLHQEAEQRRLEQQDRISRQKLPVAQPQPKSSQNVSPQQTSHNSTLPQITSYPPTQNTSNYTPQNSSSTYSNYPQSLRNPSPSQSCNNNTTTSSWRNQATTYQPHIPSPAPNGDKALPDSIIHNLTQRVNNKNSKNTYTNASGRLGNNYGSNSYRDENYHDYMNADALSVSHTHAPLYQSGMGPGQPSPPTSQQEANSAKDQRLLSVSGKKKCSHCSEELGRGAAMIIESLRLFYHIPCFKCCVCGIQLGNGSAGADVRVRNHKLHCHNCYSNDEGMKFSKV
ncbi:uncharacterized protein [Cherax quadricarinatus]|nr:uncharacterized protein LOC128689428 isoform X15 [Cherax quadricarinatus]